MTAESVIALVLTLLVLGYLVYTMLRPEEF
jgi:K+-transporting ATPase KdpF subunit